jgi:DDE superfamily endonuclease
VTPDGIIVYLWGPFSGRRHDAELYRVSALLETLEEHFNDEEGPYPVYADSAFPISPHLQKPIPGAHLAPEEALFNTIMSTVRVSIEWSFRGVTGRFQALNWKQNQKILEIPVAQWYLVASLFANLHTCLKRGNQVSDLFGMQPPSVHDYLRTY